VIEGDITRMLKCIKKLKERMIYIRKTSSWDRENRGFANGIDFSIQAIEETLAVDSTIDYTGER